MNEAAERKLLEEVEETRVLVEGVLKALVGKEKTEDYVRRTGVYLMERRYDKGTPLYKCDLGTVRIGSFWDADLLTLEEVAARPRVEVRGLSGIGRVTMRRLDAAMADKGLTWAEAG